MMSSIRPAVKSIPFSQSYERLPIVNYLADALEEVAEVIAPVWPLKDYVAVNPYMGLSHRSFLQAREYLRQFSDCETLMPLGYYATEFRRGTITTHDIEQAISELATTGFSQNLTATEIAKLLADVESVTPSIDVPAKLQNNNRPLRTVAEYVTAPNEFDWTEAIVDDISKHCSAYYDEGQAVWSAPNTNVSLYQAWRSVSEHDYNIEILGLSGFRSYVARLPFTPEAAIFDSLQQLNVPQPLWAGFLLCQAFSIPGWSAWTKYQTSWRDNAAGNNDDLVCLLAIRLAYDAALAKANSLTIDWHGLSGSEVAYLQSSHAAARSEMAVRYVLLRASEIHFRTKLLQSINPNVSSTNASENRKLAQLVFCIDVRSERIRRQLESQSKSIETMGFAGFFGMAFEFQTYGQTSKHSQLPVLLKPQFKVHEGTRVTNPFQESATVTQRQQCRSWRLLWKSFQTSAVSCFSFVESAGLLSGIRLLQRAMGFCPKSPEARFDGIAKSFQPELGPTLRGLCQQGLSTSKQADMAEGMLRNLGLTKDFAKLVVFCGHACQTTNNPLAASLDCGACGGHSGEPNARFAALLLNQTYIRSALKERGIDIPSDTYFLGGLHNTTTDRIDFFDVDQVPSDCETAMAELKSECEIATVQAQTERMPTLCSQSHANLIKRASDWSEVRPEWGLAGNAAFIVAPRSMSKGASLDARAFLHSYDFTQDPEGKVLETIMTAPMIVAHWINTQYYASTVDHEHFGSGNKMIHNVVGGFGILSGNGGDLKTGLPWQSLHNGTDYQHLPLRLQVVINAPRSMIDRVIAKHELVSNLLTGHWLHLIAIEGQQFYRLSNDLQWEMV